MERDALKIRMVGHQKQWCNEMKGYLLDTMLMVRSRNLRIAYSMKVGGHKFIKTIYI